MRIGLGFNLSIWSMPLVKNKSITGDRKSFRISTAGRWSASWFPQRWLQVGWWQNDKKRPCQNVPLSTVSNAYAATVPCVARVYPCIMLHLPSALIQHRHQPDDITDPWSHHRSLMMETKYGIPRHRTPSHCTHRAEYFQQMWRIGVLSRNALK